MITASRKAYRQKAPGHNTPRSKLLIKIRWFWCDWRSTQVVANLVLFLRQSMEFNFTTQISISRMINKAILHQIMMKNLWFFMITRKFRTKRSFRFHRFSEKHLSRANKCRRATKQVSSFLMVFKLYMKVLIVPKHSKNEWFSKIIWTYQKNGGFDNIEKTYANGDPFFAGGALATSASSPRGDRKLIKSASVSS